MEYFPRVIYSVVCSLLGLIMQMLYLLAQPCIFLKEFFFIALGEKKKRFNKVSIHFFPQLLFLCFPSNKIRGMTLLKNVL